MKISKVTNSNKLLIQAFIKRHQLTNVDVTENTYVIEHQENFIGLFEIKQVDENNYWLRKLFIVSEEALKLPIVLEYILTFIKNKNAKAVYVYSELPVTDLLLASLQFSIEENIEPFTLEDRSEGKWWTYYVS